MLLLNLISRPFWWRGSSPVGPRQIHEALGVADGHTQDAEPKKGGHDMTMVLENDVLRVELDPRTGGFRSIYDKARGHEFVGAPDRSLLFRLMAPTEDVAGEHLDATGAKIDVSGVTARIAYDLGEAKVDVTLQLEGPSIEVSLRVENTGSRNIEEILFPCLRGLAPVEDASLIWPDLFCRKIDQIFAGDDVPFTPAGLGGDHHTWNEWTQKRAARYPEHLASAWCDYGSEEGGIALEGRHTDFGIMDFFVHKIVEKDFAPDQDDPVRRTLDLAISHPRRGKPGEVWRLSPVRIRVHEGDWHTVADEHRQWLETWTTKPMRPAKFAEAVGWHFYFMKHQDGLEVNSYDDLPKMAEAALAAGCPYLLIFGWQVGGHDNNYMYRYVANEAWGGAKTLKAMLDKLRAMGVEVMPFYNGTLANIELDEHKEFGHRWEAKTRAGHPYFAGDWARHNFDAATRNRAMLHHEIAPCAEHRAYFLDTVRRMTQEYGFGNLQLDQIAEKMFVDYNEDHIETTPDRVYVDGLGELLPAVRDLVRQANPEGVVISEGLNDFTGQWCDSSWDWTLCLPFPEPILYTLPWLFASHEVDALEYGQVNQAFAYKLHLDMKIDGGDAPITKYPKFAAHVKTCAKLRRRVADYYVYGDFRDQEAIETAGPDHTVVKVYHNRSAGKVGIVVAEVGGRTAEVSIQSQWPVAGDVVKSDSNAGEQRTLPAGNPLQVSLGPYEVTVLCLDLAD